MQVADDGVLNLGVDSKDGKKGLPRHLSVMLPSLLTPGCLLELSEVGRAAGRTDWEK